MKVGEIISTLKAKKVGIADSSIRVLRVFCMCLVPSFSFEVLLAHGMFEAIFDSRNELEFKSSY